MSTRELVVELGNRSYPIRIGRGLAPKIRELVDILARQSRKVAVITDSEVDVHQSEFLTESFGESPRFVVPKGETSKSFQQLEACCDFLAERKLDRHDVLFAVGGGVIGDLAGFAAASYLRGIAFYQVPTTLLSMVDSSVGGKTGINLKAGKNLVGAFHQPQGVFADLETLKTLPAREFSSGMAEVIKHGMLASSELFEKLEKLETLSAESPEMAAIVEANCRIKAEVVKADETEQAASGGRALLNLGHTFGHAIEAVSGYGSILHGEAVGIGLVKAAELSARLGLIGSLEVERVVQLVQRYQLPTAVPRELKYEELYEAMTRDKKAKSGKIKFVILECIGKAITKSDIPLQGVWGE